MTTKLTPAQDLDTYEVNTDEAWESTGAYSLGLAVSALVGTNMHITDEAGSPEPVSTDEIRKLAARDTFDWLLG